MSLGKMVIVCGGLIALTTSLFAQSQMEQRWKAQAMDNTLAFDLNGKKFQDSSFKTKSFASSTSGLQKEFQTKEFGSKDFDGKKDAKAAQRTFQTDTASQQAKQFQTQGADNLKDKNFQSKTAPDQEKKVAGSDRTVASQNFKPEAKTPGYWASFREKLKKDLTMDEIRELLNKPPAD